LHKPITAVVRSRGAFTVIRDAPRKDIFQYRVAFKNTFSNCHSILKQTAMGSPLGAAFFFLWGAANLKRLGNTELQEAP